MVKFKIATDVRKTTARNLVLDPFSKDFLLPKDNLLVKSIVGIDCSWNLADKAFSKTFSGIKRKLPPLLAGNPVNYSKLHKLTTAEAISASLFILGFKDDALNLLNKFKWGHTFYELNQNLLEEYSKLKSEEDLFAVLKEYEISG